MSSQTIFKETIKANVNSESVNWAWFMLNKNSEIGEALNNLGMVAPGDSLLANIGTMEELFTDSRVVDTILTNSNLFDLVLSNSLLTGIMCASPVARAQILQTGASTIGPASFGRMLNSLIGISEIIQSPEMYDQIFANATNRNRFNNEITPWRFVRVAELLIDHPGAAFVDGVEPDPFLQLLRPGPNPDVNRIREQSARIFNHPRLFIALRDRMSGRNTPIANPVRDADRLLTSSGLMTNIIHPENRVARLSTQSDPLWINLLNSNLTAGNVTTNLININVTNQTIHGTQWVNTVRGGLNNMSGNQDITWAGFVDPPYTNFTLGWNIQNTVNRWAHNLSWSSTFLPHPTAEVQRARWHGRRV